MRTYLLVYAHFHSTTKAQIPTKIKVTLITMLMDELGSEDEIWVVLYHSSELQSGENDS